MNFEQNLIKRKEERVASSRRGIIDKRKRSGQSIKESRTSCYSYGTTTKVKWLRINFCLLKYLMKIKQKKGILKIAAFDLPRLIGPN